MQISIYAGSFVFTLFPTVLNLVSLNRLDWITYSAKDSLGLPLKTVWGLFEVCDFGPNGQYQCRPFPKDDLDCSRPELELGIGGWYKPFTFCDSYRTAGYSAQLAAVFGCTALISHVIIVSRGRHFRNHGWKVLIGFILANATCQIFTTGLVVHQQRTVTQVITPGSYMSTAFILSQISWGTDILLFACLLAAGIVHAKNGSPDGYREIPGTSRSRRSHRWSDEEDEDET